MGFDSVVCGEDGFTILPLPVQLDVLVELDFLACHMFFQYADLEEPWDWSFLRIFRKVARKLLPLIPNLPNSITWRRFGAKGGT